MIHFLNNLFVVFFIRNKVCINNLFLILLIIKNKKNKNI